MKDDNTLIVLTPGFAKDEADTACIPAQQGVIKMLNKHYPHLKIIIVSFHYPNIYGEYEWYGNKVISIGGREKGKLQTMRSWRQVWGKLRQLNKEHNIAGILSFWHLECAFVGHYFAKWHKLQHKNWLWGQDAKKGNKYVKLAKMQGNDLVTLSDFLASEFYKNYGVRPAHVVPLGIDPDTFKNITAERTIDLLGVGSLIPLKQYDLFVDVVNAIRMQVPGVRAVICGKGPEKEKLEEQTKLLGLEKVIELKGELAHEQVIELMQRSKILLHTSEYEGFGAVMVEALYAGAKVVSFVKPMNKKIENWHIAKDKEEMATIAIGLLKSEATRYEPVLYRSGEDVARDIVALFGIK